MPDPGKDYSVVCFGEILGKMLPAGCLAAGASLNLAYHFKKIGIIPALITRVGQDDLGKRLVNLIDGYGMSTDFLQMDFELETGKEAANFRERDEPVYDIPYPAAWDNIGWDKDFEQLMSGTPYLVLGNLITRSYLSRETALRLAGLAKFKIIDINFRLSPFNRPVMESLLPDTHLLKLSLEDLYLITGWFADYRNEDDRIKVIQEKFNIANIIVTRNTEGIIWRTAQTLYKYTYTPADPENSAGNGHAFLAGIVSKLIEKTTPDEALDFACRLDAFVSSCPEAYPDYTITKRTAHRIPSFQKIENFNE